MNSDGQHIHSISKLRHPMNLNQPLTDNGMLVLGKMIAGQKVEALLTVSVFDSLLYTLLYFALSI